MSIFYKLLPYCCSLGLFLLAGFPALACTTCNKPLQAAIFDASFARLLCYMLLPFAVAGLIVHRLHKLK